MKRNVGNYIVFGLSGLMIFTGVPTVDSPVRNVSARETALEAEGKHGEDVFQATFPTDIDHIFDFIMDPQGLIDKTDAAVYGDYVFEKGATLFFRRYDGECDEDYSSSSDALVITNSGTEEVDIVLTASISLDSMCGITLTDDRDFIDDMDASLYLALTDGEDTVPIDSETEVSIHAVLEGISDRDETRSEYRFWLTGAVNKNGDWSEVEDAAPEVVITWRVTQRENEDQEETELFENNAGQSIDLVIEEDINKEEQSPYRMEGSLEEENFKGNSSQGESDIAGKDGTDEESAGGQDKAKIDVDRGDQNEAKADENNGDQNEPEIDENSGDQNRADPDKAGEDQDEPKIDESSGGQDRTDPDKASENQDEPEIDGGSEEQKEVFEDTESQEE